MPSPSFAHLESLFYDRERTVSTRAMLLLAYMAEIVDHDRGTVLAVQGSPSNDLSLIASGEAALTQVIPVPGPPR